jgi:hypothetical protein
MSESIFRSKNDPDLCGAYAARHALMRELLADGVTHCGQQGAFDAIGRIVDNLHISAVPSLGEL